MNKSKLRLILIASLSLLAAAAVVFYHRQNSGAQIGGGISVAKSLWLAYAIGAWFILPPILMCDQRIDRSIRRIYRWFWIAMVVRGVVELLMLYLVVHWNPWYGISHDLFCLGLIVWLRTAGYDGLPRPSKKDASGSTALEDRRTEPGTNRLALALSSILCISLIAETCFAAMFMQTRAHEQGIYFASADPSWNYINFITWIVVAFVYTTTIVLLFGLFAGPTFDCSRNRFGRVVAGVHTIAGAALVLLLLAALGHWSHMMRVEHSAEQFKQVGFEIMDDCYAFTEAFLAGDDAAMRQFSLPCRFAWEETKVDHDHDFQLVRWQPSGKEQDFAAAMQSWRSQRPTVKQAAFKIHLMDEVVSPREAVVQLRFEVTGDISTDAGLIRCRFTKAEDDHWRVTAAELIQGRTTRRTFSAFTDRASTSGADFTVLPDLRFEPGETCDRHDCQHPGELRFQMMRFAYASCSTADYDGDGHDDVFFCSGQTSALMRNQGDGTFEDATQASGLGELWHVNTAGFADIDNDGDQDLLAFAFYGRNYVFRNEGDGTFTDVTEQTGLMNDDIVACYAFLDYDNDGDLDLYLGRPLDAREDIPDSFLYTRNGQPNILYRNDGGFQFTDVTEEAGAGDVGLTLSLAVADYDADGDQDIYVANDFGRNVLLQNQGDGAFRDVAQETGTLAIGGSMSASWGDYDNDGRLDLYVAAIRSNQRWFVQPITARRVVMKFFREGRFLTTNPLFNDLRDRLGDDWLEIGNHALAGNSLLQQQPDGTFIDVAEQTHTRPAGWYWSSGFFDLDNDGDLDIYASNGWITGENPHDL